MPADAPNGRYRMRQRCYAADFTVGPVLTLNFRVTRGAPTTTTTVVVVPTSVAPVGGELPRTG